MVANVESICPTIAADTEWRARKLSGMNTERADLYESVDGDALHVVKAVRRKTTNAIILRFSSLAHIKELGGTPPRVTHSKRHENQSRNLRGLLEHVCDVHLFKVMEDGGKSPESPY